MIHKNWAELIKPTQLDVKPGNDPMRAGHRRRRTARARLWPDARQRAAPRAAVVAAGRAITSVQIDNVLHEFSSVAGVREDVTDIVLNLKGVALRMEVEGPKRLSISAKGPGVVTAGDISDSAGIEILNKDHVICHLDEGADLFMELTVNTGKGYVAADKNKPEDAPIGLIPIDAIYSPVKKVSYDVQPTREGQVLDYDKLTMKVETDGSVTPDDAVALPRASCRTSCRSSSTSTSRNPLAARTKTTGWSSTRCCSRRWTSWNCRCARPTASRTTTSSISAI
jgi:DNA-directed RNA polymerase subunit alpha